MMAGSPKDMLLLGVLLWFSFSYCFPTSSKIHRSLLGNIAPRPPKSICYAHIGCFSTNGTFAGIMAILPDSPDVIGTGFALYSKHNLYAGHNIHYENAESLYTPYFDPTLNTVVLVHGWAITKDPGNWFLKSAFLNQSDYQVIVVDWRKGSQPPAYWTAAVNAEVVGRQIAVLLQELRVRRSLQPNKIHLLGSSLGAHAAGFAGKWTQSQYGFSVGRISGNDPASPYFEGASDKIHISRNDANFVDIIHSNGGPDISAGDVGIWKAVGTVDFYPNGGNVQPGCKKGDPVCSHMRADELYADSLYFPGCAFKSRPCPGGYKDFQKGLCDTCGGLGCSEMGINAVKAVGRGVQYLNTNDRKPFCKP